MTNCQGNQTDQEHGQSIWISGHLYYHQGLDLVIQGFVRPLVVSLVTGSVIDAFFFIRDYLGGPHVRLRLRAKAGFADRTAASMHQHARHFLAIVPSTQSLSEAAIRRTNEYILASDLHETEDSAYPDNSFWLKPFHPEIERYGGPENFQRSIDFFVVSSVSALDFLRQESLNSRSAQITQAFLLLLQQTLGFAADEPELVDLLRYGVDSWGQAHPRIVQKADTIFKSKTDAFCQLFDQGLSEVRSLAPESAWFDRSSRYLVAGATRLSVAISTADRITRVRIGGSQLHMTASRLGLTNAEEVYLSRLLTLTTVEAFAQNKELRPWIRNRDVKRSADDPRMAIQSLLPAALAQLEGF